MTEADGAVLHGRWVRLRRWYLRGTRLLLAVLSPGADKQCPFCGWRFREFLPGGMDAAALKGARYVGGGRRRNVYCPRCESSDRERHLYLCLTHRTNVFTASLSLLHVAPARSLQRMLMRRHDIRYLTADLNSPKVMVRMDITRIACSDASFDAILCSHVLEHVQNDKQALAELYRVLKPGGWAVLQAPIAPSLARTYEDASNITAEGRLATFGHSSHVRIYGADYSARIENAGFSVELFNYAAAFGKEAASRYALIEDEQVYLCWKRVEGDAG